jgi:hypothetical protein
MERLAQDPSAFIDLERYPVTDPSSARAQDVLRAQRRSLASMGVAILPGFIKPEACAQMAGEGLALRERAHLEDVWGTPYLEAADFSFPEGHPRRSLYQSLTWVIAYDLVPRAHALRRLYEWDPLMTFVGEVLQRQPLYRMTDPLGALNVAVMDEGHTQGWHYDNAQFVVSLALQASNDGGKFECAPFIRSPEEESYEDVARVLAGEAPDLVRVLPMVPGTLMIFEGRYSIHRVSPVLGAVPRIVALLAYDTRPESDTSDLFKMLRYGRCETVEGR